MSKLAIDKGSEKSRSQNDSNQVESANAMPTMAPPPEMFGGSELSGDSEHKKHKAYDPVQQKEDEEKDKKLKTS